MRRLRSRHCAKQCIGNHMPLAAHPPPSCRTDPGSANQSKIVLIAPRIASSGSGRISPSSSPHTSPIGSAFATSRGGLVWIPPSSRRGGRATPLRSSCPSARAGAGRRTIRGDRARQHHRSRCRSPRRDSAADTSQHCSAPGARPPGRAPARRARARPSGRPRGPRSLGRPGAGDPEVLSIATTCSRANPSSTAPATSAFCGRSTRRCARPASEGLPQIHERGPTQIDTSLPRAPSPPPPHLSLGALCQCRRLKRELARCDRIDPADRLEHLESITGRVIAEHDLDLLSAAALRRILDPRGSRFALAWPYSLPRRLLVSARDRLRDRHREQRHRGLALLLADQSHDARGRRAVQPTPDATARPISSP